MQKTKPTKRKVISPVQSSEQSSVLTGTQIDTNRSNLNRNQSNSFVSPEFYQQTKSYHQGSPGYFEFGPAKMSMNFQQVLFGGSFMQQSSQPFNSQFPASGVPPNVASGLTAPQLAT